LKNFFLQSANAYLAKAERNNTKTVILKLQRFDSRTLSKLQIQHTLWNHHCLEGTNFREIRGSPLPTNLHLHDHAQFVISIFLKIPSSLHYG
jgi:hypothetical protein